MDAWTYKAVIAEWQKPSYRWGLTHGDFHPGQILVNPENLSDMIMVDWEFTGIMGNPGVDLVTWTFNCPETFIEKYEMDFVKSYYEGLLSAGVDSKDYLFEDLWSDYKIYGAT